MESIVDIFTRHNTDKGPSFHNYSRQYDPLLKDFREKSIKLFEIGVHNGGSLRAWRDVFPNATQIVGADIRPSCKQHEDTEKEIYVEIVNATTPESIEIIHSKYGSFDIIIDDGSHRNIDVIHTFELMFPLLNENGIYIIEDTICYKSPEHLVSPYPNHLNYFIQFISFLNQWRLDSTEGIRDNCIDPFKILKKTTNKYEQSIDKIEFGCSYVAVFKKTRFHWI